MKTDSIMKSIMLALAAAVPLAAAPARAAEENNPKSVLILKLSSLETADMRAKKSIKRPNTQMLKNIGTQDLPFSQVALSKLSGRALLEAEERNRQAKQRYDAMARVYALEEFKRTDEEFRADVAKLQQTADGRMLALSIDKFAGFLGEYADCIQFFHRMDQEEAAVESKMTDMLSNNPDADLDYASAACFVRLVFGDIHESKSAVDLPGGMTVTNIKYVRQLTVEIQDLTGKMIFSKNIDGVASARFSNVVGAEDKSESLLLKVTEDCLKKAAEAIDKRFVCKVSFKIVGPKGDEDFDPDSVELTMDGNGISADTPMRVRKGVHEVVAKLDNYAQSGVTKLRLDTDGERKIILKSAMCAVTLKMKGPAGDAGFDPSNATVQLVDADGNASDLSADEAVKVLKGKYDLVATLDGYTAKKQKVTLASQKKALTVIFAKAKAAAAE